MNDDGGYTIYCSRCGAKMSSNSRYCMKCGNLNYDHEANKNMRRYMPKKKKKSTGKFISTEVKEPSPSTGLHLTVSTRTGSKTLCFSINFLVYLILIVLSFLATTQGSFDLEKIMVSAFPKFAVSISFSFLYLYALQLIFMKCNHPWWEALIPFYNALVLGDIVFENKWIGALSFVPGVNIIYMMVLFYKLGEAFHLPKYLTAILFPIFIPIMGFGADIYNGFLFVNSEAQKETEREYQYRKVFLFALIIVIVFGLALSLMHGLSRSGADKNSFDGLYFSYASGRLVSKVQEEIKNKNADCKYGYTKDSGIYYFQFSDVGDAVFLPFYIMRDPIEGYVKVDNSSGKSMYYVSMTDGNLGFPETLSSDIRYTTITKYNEKADFKVQDLNTCVIVK